ncbi:MAG: archaetidylserine decarboxylase [Gemmatimonadota bacterium]|nr:archaetidylserine decarboxylase [Gemmatimonadota bacterium]
MTDSSAPPPPVPDVTPSPPPLTWRAVLRLLGRLPQGALSRGLGNLADAPIPRPFRTAVLTAFAKAVGIDPAEAERPIRDYGSVNEFFVRRLRPGARTWPAEPGLASPVDGIVGQVGRIDGGRLIQAKGLDYAAADLLGEAEEADRFEGGSFITLYLSPRHYHRIHAPVDGTISLARYVPGALLPVNEPAVRHLRDLFARNERLLAHIDGPLGRLALVAVGAYNVGRISAAFDPAWSGTGGMSRRPWVTNRTEDLPRERRYDDPIPVGRGDEIMAFHLGSTVVLLTEPSAGLVLEERCAPGTEVRLGALLARPPGGA